MGVEVKGAGDGVVIADRGCNDCYNRDCYNRNFGWALDGEPSGVHWQVVSHGAAAVSVWDKINDTKADIQKVEATAQ